MATVETLAGMCLRSEVGAGTRVDQCSWMAGRENVARLSARRVEVGRGEYVKRGGSLRVREVCLEVAVGGDLGCTGVFGWACMH